MALYFTEIILLRIFFGAYVQFLLYVFSVAEDIEDLFRVHWAQDIGCRGMLLHTPLQEMEEAKPKPPLSLATTATFARFLPVNLN